MRFASIKLTELLPVDTHDAPSMFPTLQTEGFTAKPLDPAHHAIIRCTGVSTYSDVEDAVGKLITSALLHAHLGDAYSGVPYLDAAAALIAAVIPAEEDEK